MKLRGKGRIAKILVLVMFSVFLCGSTVMAEEQTWYYAGNIPAGAYLEGITAKIPYGEFKDYSDYTFKVNGNNYASDAEGRVFLDRSYYVKEVTTDDGNKTITVSGDPMIRFQIGDKDEWKKAGDEVTVNLTKEYKTELDKLKEGKTFIKWYVWLWNGGDSIDSNLEESAAFLGVEPEVLKNPECTITFKIPAAWGEYKMAGIAPAIDGADSTVSGNTISKPGKNESGSTSSSDTAEMAAADPEAESKQEVVLSNGTTLASAGAMHNVTRGINGAAIVTPQADMNTRAGLSRKDVEAGTNAKIYMGNTYKKAEKDLLLEAASQTDAALLNMINIDLYSIAKSGKVEAVKMLADGEPIRMVIGLPAGIAKEGRSFALVYMGADGKAVEIPDQDNDLRTLTVDLTRFGAFALVYR